MSAARIHEAEHDDCFVAVERARLRVRQQEVFLADAEAQDAGAIERRSAAAEKVASLERGSAEADALARSDASHLAKAAVCETALRLARQELATATADHAATSARVNEVRGNLETAQRELAREQAIAKATSPEVGARLFELGQAIGQHIAELRAAMIALFEAQEQNRRDVAHAVACGATSLEVESGYRAAAGFLSSLVDAGGCAPPGEWPNVHAFAWPLQRSSERAIDDVGAPLADLVASGVRLLGAPKRNAAAGRPEDFGREHLETLAITFRDCAGPTSARERLAALDRESVERRQHFDRAAHERRLADAAAAEAAKRAAATPRQRPKVEEPTSGLAKVASTVARAVLAAVPSASRPQTPPPAPTPAPPTRHRPLPGSGAKHGQPTPLTEHGPRPPTPIVPPEWQRKTRPSGIGEEWTSDPEGFIDPTVG
jgi:hypothetical protein